LGKLTAFWTVRTINPLAVPMNRRIAVVEAASLVLVVKSKAVTSPQLGSILMLLREKNTVFPMIDEIVTVPPVPITLL
jgi:hypothetical protein